MTLDDIKHLKEVCAKATPEDWEAGWVFRDTFTPQTVAELLELAERLLVRDNWTAPNQELQDTCFDLGIPYTWLSKDKSK